MIPFNPNTYKKVDTQSEYYSDFTVNFDIHPQNSDLARLKNENSIKRGLINLFKTKKYERPFKPTFGSKLTQYLFEPISTLTQTSIQNEVTEVITNFEPRINLISVIVTPDIQNDLYVVSISYYIINKIEPITINIVLNRIR